jgi:hypothetical protein
MRADAEFDATGNLGRHGDSEGYGFAQRLGGISAWQAPEGR